MQVKLLLLDNNDSFVYNLYQYLSEIFTGKITVINNQSITLNEVKDYDIIVLSPGPDLPLKAGKMLSIIKTYYLSKPILGVCLGHQAIYEAFGGRLKNLETVYHGIDSPLTFEKEIDPIFNGLNKKIVVGRYHSWMADETTLPNELLVTARDSEGQIMAITHKYLPIKGLQFHPESYLTNEGKQILKNFLKLAKQKM